MFENSDNRLELFCFSYEKLSSLRDILTTNRFSDSSLYFNQKTKHFGVSIPCFIPYSCQLVNHLDKTLNST